MTLAKAIFKSLEKKDGKTSETDVLTVNFNPKELSLERTMSYAPAQNTQQGTTEQSYKGSANFTLSMTLYFDTFEEGANVRSKYMTKLENLTKPRKYDPNAAGSGTGSGGTSGTGTTGTGTGTGGTSGSSSSSSSQKTDPPPNVLFVWGKFRFCGVITSLSQKYTMFFADGTPVRAEATLTMTQTMASEADNDLGGGDQPEIGPNKVANDLKEKGATALAGVGPGSDFDDPQEIINNASKLDAAKAAAAAKKDTGLSGFMDKHGTDLLNKVGAAAVGGYLSGGTAGLKSGVFEGALSSAGDTGLFSGATGGSTLGKAADTLASGKQLNLASVGLGVGNDKLGNLGGGLAIGVQRNGGKLDFGMSSGGGIGTPGGTTLAGFESNQTRSTDGSHSSTTAAGVGVGSPGRPGAPITLPTVPVRGGGGSSGSGRTGGDPASGSGSGSGTTTGTGSGSGGNTGGGGGSGRGGGSGSGTSSGTTGGTGGGSGSGSGGNTGSGGGGGRGGGT